MPATTAHPASERPSHEALLVIDVQNDFIPGGALAVPEGDLIVPLINRLGRRFQQVVVTQDWHPAGHASFASSHPGHAPFSRIQLPYGPQVLWPEHCVQASHGAELHPDLRLEHAQLILRKGCNLDIDSYSAFVEADRSTVTGLAGYLRQRGIDTLYLAGLALDYCVAWSALDARAAGFTTFVVLDACRAIDLDGSRDAALAHMREAGVGLIHSSELPPLP
ncbi:bifunctional nicotinamidase/pyrazinamidase [Pseudomonas chlororaphis]|uniref:Nicotinamidase n=1 Tax=Pseudomonas chlororaphis TaxID=587753 RepID=A0A1Q8EPA2_9PSED|nr:bifunctional nicotinamidase/pyrazinamidase [Pseudomonas chlororaphis]OLF53605.1 nicotinamidase [Pseudomonas chlororaphis]